MWPLPTIMLLVALPAVGQSDAIQKDIAAGRYQEALKTLGSAPENSVRWHLLASKAYDGAGDPARAVSEAEAALALEPANEAANLQLGQIFLGRNTPAAALDIFSEGLAQRPDSILLRLGRALALKDLLRYDQAESELLKCLELKPGLPIAFETLATVYLQAKRFSDLERFARDYRSRYPGEYRAPYFIAAALEGSKSDSAEIEPLLAESLAVNPAFAASHALLGKVRLNNGNPNEAIAPLEKALQLRPDYSPAALHLAQAYQKSGRLEDADRAFAMVRRLKQKEQEPRPSLLYHRGERR
jgi:Flp pilus assembly protein TadD